MNTPQFLSRAEIGTAGLDDVIGSGSEPVASARGRPGHGKDHDCASVPDRGRQGRRGRRLRQFGRNRTGASGWRSVARLGVGASDRNLRARSPIDLTYLADNVLLLRFFEAAGRIRRAVSVVKKRTGSHENTIRKFHVDRRGIAVGPPLERFQGVLRGVPTYVGSGSPLMEASD
jgi:circadian clock protein KaiC